MNSKEIEGTGQRRHSLKKKHFLFSMTMKVGASLILHSTIAGLAIL
jgi:hypothetical protein